MQELEEEEVMFEKFASDEGFRQDMSDKLRQFGKVPERYYDAVMMRHEFSTLKAKHEQGSS